MLFNAASAALEPEYEPFERGLDADMYVTKWFIDDGAVSLIVE
jgi:hypothetical protein